MTLVRVGAQQVGVACSGEDCRQLPAQVEPILHRDVHALAGLGTVGVTGVSRDEDTRSIGVRGEHVVEAVAQALADLIHRPPRDITDVEGVRREDPPARVDEVIDREMPRGDAFALTEIAELDVEPNQIAALARDDDHVSLRGLDDGLDANVGEVRVDEHVHDPPRMISGFALERTSHRRPHGTSRAIAAHEVLGMHHHVGAAV